MKNSEKKFKKSNKLVKNFKNLLTNVTKSGKLKEEKF